MKKLILMTKKKYNAGSAIVNVMIVVAFMSILATISLAIAGTNYKMKISDYNTKEGFYESEEVVELLRAQLILDTKEAAEAAFKITGSQYCEKGNVTGREELYLSHFKTQIVKVWEKHWDNAGTIDVETGIVNLFPGAVFETGDGYNSASNTCTFHIVVNGKKFKCVINEIDDVFKYKNAIESDAITGNHLYKYDYVLNKYETDASDNRVVTSYYIKQLDIFVTNDKGYSSRIQTSFMIMPPSFNWNENGNLSDKNGNAITEMTYSDCVLYYQWAKE